MTLKEWCQQANVKPTHPTTERQAVSLIATEKKPNFTQLWNLDDYAVSSRCGIVLWLVPKNKDQA